MAKSVQAIERACDLIFLIASSKTGLGISELACELDLAKSAVHRILVALCAKSMVYQDPLNQRYCIHPRVLQLSIPFQEQSDIVSIARPYLDALRDQFQETVVLVLRDGFNFMTIAHSPSSFELRFSPTTGRRMSLHWGAFGKAILASLPEDELSTFLKDTPFQSATSKTTADPNLLLEELKLIRERGFSLSVSEVIEGNVGLAAPIFLSQQQPVGCIGLGGPEVRLKHCDLNEIGGKLVEAAGHISNILALLPR